MLSITVNSKNKGATVSFPKVLIFLDISGRSVFSVAQPFTVEIAAHVAHVGRLEPLKASPSWLLGTCSNSRGEQLFQEAGSAPASAGAEPWTALGSLHSWSNSSHVPLRPSRQAPAPPSAGQVEDLVANQSHPGVDS